MLKRSLIAVVIALVFSSLGWAQIDKIAIFNESVGWTDVATAQAATDIILANVTSASDISIYNDAEMGDFATANTGDGNFDMMIIFGYFPVSLYTPGNVQPDGSLGELFLEGGDMIVNTADYIFYVTEGGAANEATGLTNMTDSTFDMWADGNVNGISDAGPALTPSVPVSYDAPRPFKRDQIEADPDWEVEVVFGSNDLNLDPVIIRNLTYGGRVGIVFQVSDNAMPRGDVMSEMIENYIAENLTAVEPAAKLTTTWGAMK